MSQDPKRCLTAQEHTEATRALARALYLGSLSPVALRALEIADSLEREGRVVRAASPRPFDRAA